MKKLLILPAVLFALALGACDADNNDDPAPMPTGPVTTVVPSEVPTSVPTMVPSSGQPSISVKPTTTVVPSEVTEDPDCGPLDDNCGDATDKPKDGK